MESVSLSEDTMVWILDEGFSVKFHAVLCTSCFADEKYR